MRGHPSRGKEASSDPDAVPGLTRSVRNNTCFVEAVAELARLAGCKLTICPQAENRNDRWIQVPTASGQAQPGREGLWNEAGWVWVLGCAASWLCVLRLVCSSLLPSVTWV